MSATYNYKLKVYSRDKPQRQGTVILAKGISYGLLLIDTQLRDKLDFPYYVKAEFDYTLDAVVFTIKYITSVDGVVESYSFASKSYDLVNNSVDYAALTSDCLAAVQTFLDITLI